MTEITLVSIAFILVAIPFALNNLTNFFAHSIIGLFIASNHTDSKDRGLILTYIRMLSENFLGDYWSKPFLGCYKCMPSLWVGVPAVLLSAMFIVLLQISLLWVLPSIVLSIYLTASVSSKATLIYSEYELNSTCSSSSCEVEQEEDSEVTVNLNDLRDTIKSNI